MTRRRGLTTHGPGGALGRTQDGPEHPRTGRTIDPDYLALKRMLNESVAAHEAAKTSE